MKTKGNKPNSHLRLKHGKLSLLASVNDTDAIRSDENTDASIER